MQYSFDTHNPFPNMSLNILITMYYIFPFSEEFAGLILEEIAGLINKRHFLFKLYFYKSFYLS